MDKNRIYISLPTCLQNMACSIEGRRIEEERYGSVFETKKAEYASSAKLQGEQLHNYQNERLKKIIDHCYKTVPHYTQLFDKLGLKPEDISGVDELTKLPILTKAEIKSDPDKFVSSAVSKEERYIHNTGGTSGAGLAFWTTHSEDSEQWAVWWRYRNNIGITRDKWCGLFGGKVIMSLDCHKGPYWRTNKPGKQIFFSSYHINEDTVIEYADALEKNKITWIHGYPTVIAEFARLLNLKNRHIHMDYVTVGSENMTENHKQTIKQAFGVEPYQHYGLTEGVANFSQDSERKLRIDEDFSYVEFVQNEYGYSIIGTTFTNYAMPLLRYDTGDYGELSDHQDGGFRIVDSISGRASEYIRKPDGSVITSAAISLIFNSFPEIVQGQLVVKKDGSVDINMILQKDLATDREKELRYKIRERFGGQIDFSLNTVNELKKTKSGKTKLIIEE